MADTITGSLSSNQLCSVSDVFQYKDISASNTASVSSLSAFVNSLITRVSSHFENECKSPLRLQTFYGLFDGSGNDTLLFKFPHKIPIVSIQTFQKRNTITSSWETVTDNYYIYDNKLVFYNTSFIYGKQNYAISYSAGYQEYDNLNQATIEAVSIKLKESNFGGQISQNMLGESTRQADSIVTFNTTFQDLTERFKDVLQHYKRKRI